VHVPAAPTSAAAPRPEAPAARPEAPAPSPPTVDTPPPRAEFPLSRSATTPGKPPRASLAEEVAQLKKAKLALKSGDAGKALSELDTYASRFPRPILGAEATVLRIESLSRRGDAARARALAETFLAKHPDSPYAARLRGLTVAN
jgi:TolA-binding protein